MWLYKPTIIAVTGNAGKTSTKEAIAVVLGSQKRVRSGKGNLNNEFGVPLTIIGDWMDDYYEAGNTLGFWVKVLSLGFVRWFYKRDYPEVLVLEYGADHPGDIKKLARRYKPHIGVVTAVGDVPVHIEFFKDADSVAKEKANLVKVLGTNDYAILNHDDDRVLDMKHQTKSHVMTFGFEEGSTVRITDFAAMSNEEGVPLGTTFKLHQGSSFVPVTINGSLGKSQAWAAAAAAVVGIVSGINLVKISEALGHYSGPRGRLKILKGIKNSHIIDDTYNASPASTRLALEVLRDLPGVQWAPLHTCKIAVLGDMLELGEHTISAHQAIGSFAATFVDVLVCVGARAKFIAEAASDQMPQQNIYTFATSEEAKVKVQELVVERSVVLVKGSQGIRMEKIVEEIMAEPERKKDLLVRQSAKWRSK